MVTDRQARRLMKDLGKGVPLSAAALRSAMSENTARKYRAGALPSQRKRPRRYRTRPDPFAALWAEIEGLLKEAPGLEAVTIFETLLRRPDVCLQEGQLRTLQRKIRRWRAAEGPEREAYNFQGNLTYFWKATWGGVFDVRVFEGGVTGRQVYHKGKPYAGVYNPNPHFAYIGAPIGRSGPEGATVPGMIVRQVWISSRPRPEFANK